jgi:hypothetical protein
MKKLMFALPAMALIATAAVAQTDTTGNSTGTDSTSAATDSTSATTGMNATGQTYGTNWPLSVGTTFFSDETSSSLRGREDLDSGWQSLSQEDRDMIVADCDTFMAIHRGDATDGSGTTSTDGTAGTSTGASTSTSTGTETTATESVATGDATATTGVDAATSAPTGYDMAQMFMICEAVEGL